MQTSQDLGLLARKHVVPLLLASFVQPVLLSLDGTRGHASAIAIAASAGQEAQQLLVLQLLHSVAALRRAGVR